MRAQEHATVIHDRFTSHTGNTAVLARISRASEIGRNRTLASRVALLGYPRISITASEVVYVRAQCNRNDIARVANALFDEPFTDAVNIEWIQDNPSDSSGAVDPCGDLYSCEVLRRIGVTDRVATQIATSAHQLGFDIEVVTGTHYELRGCEGMNAADIADLVNNVLCNAVIETWASHRATPVFASDIPDSESGADSVEVVQLRKASTDQLARINSERGLALDPEEIEVVASWFNSIGRDPTDAELETIAQTWSDHCSHKTFRANITATLPDGSTLEVKPLLKQLRECTDHINAPFVVSAFDGNAGIVKFADQVALAIKAETHNHPSAIEPFGGANTGVGGVIRDVLAAPARPVALTDILCFGPRDLHHSLLPEGVLHPAIIEEGVVDGVADYGNKIGVPTVAGAVIYDRGYVANPLVFCGCVGEVMEGANHLTGARTGDHVIVVGGATGRDGIRGATFSSMTMDATTGEVAGASVQIGDPIVERLVTDLLIQILDRPQPLCSALTDCGAGGLSSAVGEMGEELGVEVDLCHVERKYRGLLPWEVWLSEAQERMVLAVPSENVAEVMRLANRIGVIANDIGTFTGKKNLIVRHGDIAVVDLPMDFLHNGRPTRQMTATISEPHRQPADVPEVDVHQILLSLLAHPTIASKEAIIRRYDHEILGATVVRPMSGAAQQGPSDGVVIASPARSSGFSLGIGVNPYYGLYDPERMAHAVVDEAIRNVVVAGADPEQIALLDNFSWGDPRRDTTLGDLVATVQGCCDGANMYGAPFVSGKDSLNNEYTDTDGHRHSIPPTLVITALGHVPDADRVVTTELHNVDNVLMLLGNTRNELRGSHLHLVLEKDFGGQVPAPDPNASQRYRLLHRAITDGFIESAHDCSEGGLSVALAEMVMASEVGIHITLDNDNDDDNDNEVVALFSESLGRIVIEVQPHHMANIIDMFGDDVSVLGRVANKRQLSIVTSRAEYVWSVQELRASWRANVEVSS